MTHLRLLSTHCRLTFDRAFSFSPIQTDVTGGCWLPDASHIPVDRKIDRHFVFQACRLFPTIGGCSKLAYCWKYGIIRGIIHWPYLKRYLLLTHYLRDSLLFVFRTGWWPLFSDDAMTVISSTTMSELLASVLFTFLTVLMIGGDDDSPVVLLTQWWWRPTPAWLIVSWPLVCWPCIVKLAVSICCFVWLVLVIGWRNGGCCWRRWRPTDPHTHSYLNSALLRWYCYSSSIDSDDRRLVTSVGWRRDHYSWCYNCSSRRQCGRTVADDCWLAIVHFRIDWWYLLLFDTVTMTSW